MADLDGTSTMSPSYRDPASPLLGTYYLSGPMSGMAQYNFPAFNHASAVLRRLGYTIISPAELDGAVPEGVTPGDNEWQSFLKRDLLAILTEDLQGVFCLEGWEKSQGAALETWIASAIGLKVYEYPGFKPIDFLSEVKPASKGAPDNVLDRAKRLVDGARQQDYGHPKIDFSRTANLWTAWLGERLNDELTAEDIALLMILLKVSRLRQTPSHYDSITDVAGYARCLQKVTE